MWAPARHRALEERREKLELSIKHAIHIRRYISTLATRLTHGRPEGSNRLAVFVTATGEKLVAKPTNALPISAVMTWASSFIDWKRAIVTKVEIAIISRGG
jgi:hypothetical protein